MPTSASLPFPADRSGGDCCVHATAVAVHGRGLLLCGAPGTGKSRLALALLDAGHSLVADDLVVIDRYAGGWRAQGIAGWEGWLAWRGDGPRDLRTVFGPRAALSSCLLHAVVALDAERPLENRTATQVRALGLPTLNLAALPVPAQCIQLEHWLRLAFRGYSSCN